jgi:hypothetical protein
VRLALVAMLGALALSACAKPVPVLDIPPVADPCPAEGLAPLRPEPVHPVPDMVERGRVFGAVIAILGEERARALVQFWETDRPTWGRQGWERVKRTKAWCDGRLHAEP